jgi:putative flippase GtrA
MASGSSIKSVSAEFIKFSVIGTLGFLVDATILHVMVTAAGLGLYVSRLISYLGAATTTWFLNRHFTFHGGANASARRRQWSRFILVNGLGGGIN